MSFVQNYSGQHSIDFIQNGSRKNTWIDFHLIPTKRPELAEPKPIIQSVNIPGTDKRIDIVGSLPEGITYDIRQGTWEFVIDHDQWSSWDEAYRELAKAIHGQYMTIMLDDGSVYGYTGRLRVQGYNPGSNWSTITIEYMLDGGRYVVGSLISKTITTNGVYRASDDEAEGYSQVTVNVYANPKLKSKSITQNGTYRASYENYDGYSSVEVDVPNTYTQSDEGKVVSNNQLVSQTSRSVTANGSYDTTTNNSVSVNVQPNLQSKTVTSNGEVTADSGYDGLSKVEVDVPNTYTQSDEGKVVSNSQLVSQTSRSVTANGSYDTTTNDSVSVNVQPNLQSKTATSNGEVTADSGYDGLSKVEVDVPNTYTQSDEGKVVSNSQLVSQTSRSVTENGSYDTTTNDSVSVNVPNTYTQSDEGKVVSNSQLVSQTSRSVTANGSYDTTTNNSVSVNVQPNLQSKTATSNGEVTADSGYDGLSSVIVSVPGGANLSSAEFNQNGTYTPSSGIDGWNSVTVSVEGVGGLSIKDIAERTISEARDNTTEKIGDYAFINCSTLNEAWFPNCSYIGTSAFANCSALMTISFPNCSYISPSAFVRCTSLTSASFPMCSSIGSFAFTNCSSLAFISFSECNYIYNNAFVGCLSLTSVSFPKCTYISNTAFYRCTHLQSVDLPICSYIGNYAFSGCTSLLEINLPICSYMGSNAFCDCSALASVSFPVCSYIGSSAFYRCRSLVSVYFFASSICTLSNSNAFQSTPIAGYTQYTGGQLGSIYVPASLADQYKTAANWSFYSERIVGI